MSTPYLILISIIGWGVGSLFYKVANDSMHPVMVTIIVTIFYMILTPIEYIVFKPNTSVSMAGVSFALAGALLMGVGSLAYFFALRNGGAGGVTAMTAIYPALTVVLSCFFLKEDFTFKKLLGVTLAFASVFILSRK